MVTKTAVPVLVAGMLLTGISNSLFNKWQDMQCVERCDDPDPSRHIEFSQPVWQTATMFLGEFLCLLPVLAMQIYRRFILRQKWIKMFTKGGDGEEAEYAPVRTSSPEGTPRNSISATNGDAAGGDGQRENETQALLPPDLRRTRSVDVRRDEDDEEGEAMTTAAAWLFFMPALCDICGTTLMNVGLLFTPVSIYQMTRGALVLWVGVFSVIFLRRSLFLFQWLCLVLVMLGVSIVGLSGTVLREGDGNSLLSSTPSVAHESAASLMGSPSLGSSMFLGGGKGGGKDEELPEAVGALLGVVLILFAQLFTASQFVLEEKIMSRYSVEPLLAVGMEGLFGLVTTLAIQIILYFAYGRSRDGRGGYFDMLAGWHQIIHTPTVLFSSFAIAASIALFNFFGLSVTRNVSATARSTIDTCRTLGIWVVSLTLGWEVFRPMSGGLQVFGFVLLCYGTLVFNAVVKPPKCVRPRRPRHARSRSRTRTRSRSTSRMRRSNTAPLSRSRSVTAEPDNGGGGGGGGGDYFQQRGSGRDGAGVAAEV